MFVLTRLVFFTQDVTVKNAASTFFTQLFIPPETSPSLVTSMCKNRILPLSESHLQFFNFTAIYSYVPVLWIFTDAFSVSFFRSLYSALQNYINVHIYLKTLYPAVFLYVTLSTFLFLPHFLVSSCIMRNRILVSMHICCTRPQVVSISLSSSSLWINVTGIVFMLQFLSN